MVKRRPEGLKRFVNDVLEANEGRMVKVLLTRDDGMVFVVEPSEGGQWKLYRK